MDNFSSLMYTRKVKWNHEEAYRSNKFHIVENLYNESKFSAMWVQAKAQHQCCFRQQKRLPMNRLRNPIVMIGFELDKGM